MKYTQAEYGRIFVMRLEDGDVIHEEVEALARKEEVQRGVLVILGGADTGSKIMVGPEDGGDIRVGMPIMDRVFSAVHETQGCGTLIPDETGNPILHLHLACGRGDESLTGCARAGVVVWRYMEAVLLELRGCESLRVKDPDTGFLMLMP